MVGDTVVLKGKIWEAKVIRTSYGAIGYLPIKNEIKKRAISGMQSKNVTDILRLLIRVEILSVISLLNIYYQPGK